MEAPGSQPATMRGAYLGIKQTLKKAEGTEEKKVGFGYTTEMLAQASPQVHPSFWTFRLVSQ